MNYILKLKIKTQFVIYFTIFSLVIILSTSYFYVNKYKHDILLLHEKYGKSIIQNISPLILTDIIVEDYFRIQKTITKVCRDNNDIERIIVVDDYGMIISDTDMVNLSKKFVWDNNSNLSIFSMDLSVGKSRYGKVYLVLNKKRIKDELNNLYARVIFSSLIFLLVSILIGNILSKFFSNPIQILLRDIENYKNRNLINDAKDIVAPHEILILYRNFYEFINIIQDREDQLKLSFDEIKNMREFIQQIVDSLPFTIVTYNSQFDVTFCNNRLYQMFDISDPIINKNILEILEDKKLVELVALLKSSDEIEQKRFQFKAIPKKFFNISIFKIETSKGLQIGLLIDDVTVDVEKDNMIFHAQKMDALGVLAGGVAHDINNVLSAMKNVLTAIEMMDHPDEIKPMLKILEKAIYRGSNIVRQILLFSRKQDVQYKSVDIAKVIDGVVGILKSTADKSIEIKTEIDGDSYNVFGDGNQLEQAILNICINACHAMTIMRKDGKKGGLLTIKLGHYKNQRNNILNCVDKNYIIISISDTGVGIPRDEIPRIFEPFYTKKKINEGTGLGLAIVHRIVKDHGGDIYVYSEEGKGTTFNILLPLVQDESISENEVNDIDIKYNLTALVVDDDNLVLNANISLLKSVGIWVIPVEEPLKAVDTFKMHKDKIDLCIIDMVMPKMSGFDVAKGILSISPEAKIVISSGYYNDPSVEEFIKENQLAFLPKPFSLKELKKCLDAIGIKPAG